MLFIPIRPGVLLGAALAAGLAACTAMSPPGGDGQYSPPSVEHQGRSVGWDAMIEALDSARAVLIGETHDRLDHHLNQLAIIERLHESHPELAIGMEQFQQPFQRYLDDYIKGEIDTEAMLLGTEYYERWKFDYRLYEPILSYARQHRIPVVALNLPRELTRKVGAEGLGALTPRQAAKLPRLDRSDADYRERLRDIYEEHPVSRHGGDFENFYTVQLLWDEGMAERAAEFLDRRPGATMVVLAGSGHVEFGSGIPSRLARRIDGDVVTVVHANGGTNGGNRADYLLHSSPAELADRGMLGVMIDPDSKDARVKSLSEDSAAAAAGLRTGDVITKLDQRPVRGLADLRARLWDKRPGERVSVTARRASGEILQLDVALR